MLRQLPAVVVAVPGIALATLALAALLFAAAGGAHPTWRAQNLNMSEAAALRDPASVLRSLRRGEDPGTRRPIRGGVLFERAVMLTPLEAAIAARRPEVVEVLLSERNVDAAVWTRARCLASSTADEVSQRVIDRYRPLDLEDTPGAVDCSEFRQPW